MIVTTEHSHPRIGVHDHVNGDLDHTHGPVADDGLVWGQTSDVHPSDTFRVHTHRGRMSPPSPPAPEVWVPYTRLSSPTVDALNRSGWSWRAVDVSGSPHDYWALLELLWRPGSPGFVIVEHDIDPGPWALWQFVACHRDWCGNSYTVRAAGRPVDVADHHTAAGPTSTALGCVRFTGEIIARHPRLVAELPDRTWQRLDYTLLTALTAQGETCHRHYPNVEHHHRYEQEPA